VIAQSWEFGGYGGEKNILAGLYIDALVGDGMSEPEFRRGDSNGDQGVDISDPVYTLGNLFPTGPPNELLCRDAADSNDDGTINIADPVHTLSFLFTMGPPPPAPGPANCGIDGTDTDPLGCDSYNCN